MFRQRLQKCQLQSSLFNNANDETLITAQTKSHTEREAEYALHKKLLQIKEERKTLLRCIGREQVWQGETKGWMFFHGPLAVLFGVSSYRARGTPGFHVVGSAFFSAANILGVFSYISWNRESRRHQKYWEKQLPLYPTAEPNMQAEWDYRYLESLNHPFGKQFDE